MSKVKNLHNFTIGELKPVEEFDRSKHYVKVISPNKKHRDMEYKEGLNVDIKPFNNNPKASCVEGGLYFTTLEFLPRFYNYGSLIAEIKIPEDAKLILDPERDKYRADRIEIIKFWSMNDFLEYVKYVEISCNACFGNLEDTRGLESLEEIGKNAHFENLENARGLENLKKINWNAYFNNLKDARGLENLEEIGYNAYFDNLKSAEGLENLKKIGHDACFFDLKSARGLENLEEIGHNVHFNSLEGTEGLKNLEKNRLECIF